MTRFRRWLIHKLGGFTTEGICIECEDCQGVLISSEVEDMDERDVPVILKPCPFCGGEAELVKDREEDGYVGYDIAYVGCQACNAKTRNYITDGYYGATTTVYDAINDWNRRATDDEK